MGRGRERSYSGGMGDWAEGWNGRFGVYGSRWKRPSRQCYGWRLGCRASEQSLAVMGAPERRLS